MVLLGARTSELLHSGQERELSNGRVTYLNFVSGVFDVSSLRNPDDKLDTDITRLLLDKFDLGPLRFVARTN